MPFATLLNTLLPWKAPPILYWKGALPVALTVIVALLIPQLRLALTFGKAFTTIVRFAVAVQPAAFVTVTV